MPHFRLILIIVQCAGYKGVLTCAPSESLNMICLSMGRLNKAKKL